MSKFIHLTLFDGRPLVLRIAAICALVDNDKGQCEIFVGGGTVDNVFLVRERADTIQSMIESQ